MYPEELVYPMRKQLTDQGFDELKSIDDVRIWFQIKEQLW